MTDANKRLELIDASLGLSYDLLSAELQKLWCMLSVFPDTFDRAAAAAVWSFDPAQDALHADATQDALSDLVKYSLTEWTALPSPDDRSSVVGRGAGGEGRYRLHDLARLFAASRLPDPDRAAAQYRHAAHYETVLRAADELYRQGGEAIKRGLALFDLEWTNIQAGQAWAAAHSRRR